MTKRKTARYSFIMSLLALLMCVAMLVTTTFAWFTDSVTSGRNKIVAGNLDVELYHSSNSLPQCTDAEKVTATTDNLFEDVALWEPGAIAYENFTVKNVGNLALKYSMMLSTWDYNSLGDHNLTEVIKVAIVDNGFIPDATDPRTQAQSLTNYKSLSTNEQVLVSDTDVFLKPGETKTFGVVMYWAPTDHDNDYNVNNGAIVDRLDNGYNRLFIEFGVNLVATQKDFEEDSFDELYDVQASNPVLSQYIQEKAVGSMTKQELNDKVESSDASVTLQTNSDVDITATIDASIAIEMLNAILAEDSQGGAEDTRLDLNLNVNTTDISENSITYDISMDGTVTTVKDGTTTVQTGAITSVSGYVLAEMNIGANLTNVMMTHSGNKMTKVADIDVLPDEADANYNPYGFYSYDYTTGTLSIKTKSFSPFNVTFEIPDVIIVPDGETKDLSEYFEDGATFSIDDAAVATVTGTVVKGIDPGIAMLKIAFDNKAVECLVYVTPFHEIVDEYTDPFVIANADQWENYIDYFAYEGCAYYTWDNWDKNYTTTVNLVGDIDLANVTIPTGSSFGEFVLNGNGHTIMNGTKPLFNNSWLTGNVTIKDVKLEGFRSDTALFSNYGEYSGNITFDNVDITDCVVRGGCAYIPYAYYTGDIVTFKNCDVKDCEINDSNGAQGFVGIFVGNSKNGVTVDSCTVTNTSVIMNSYSGSGLIGSAWDAGTIKNCSVDKDTTVIQKGSGNVCALGGATRTDNVFYGTVKAATAFIADLQGTEATFESTNPIATATDFTLNADGSISYSGSATLAKVIVNQKYTANHLKDGVDDPKSGGYPCYVEAGDGKEFTNVTNAAAMENAYARISNLRHVGATNTAALNYNLAELPTGITFNTGREAVVNDGILYIDSATHNTSYETYVAGAAAGQTGTIWITAYLFIYDANNTLLTTVTISYSIQPTTVNPE